MSTKLNKREIEKFSRQIILKNIGALGQKKIQEAKVLIIGMGGLGCPAAEFLTRSGIGTLGIVDHDRVSLSNIHRQTLYTEKDVNKSKVKIAKKKLKRGITWISSHPISGSEVSGPEHGDANLFNDRSVSYTHLTLPTKA